MAGEDSKINSGVAKPMTVKAFTCPSCGGQVNIRAMGQSLSAVCGSCSSIIDISNENYKIIAKCKDVKQRNQVIAMGTRGVLRGSPWEAIGYMERSDKSGVYVWSEYLLFNPMKGFRWLTEFNGHWNYVVMTKEQPVMDTSGHFNNYGKRIATYLGKDYSLFTDGKAVARYVIGEFYWQIHAGETYQIEDYVSPPQMLSREFNKTENIWSISEYVDADEIKSAFKISGPMPIQTGVAPNQPSAWTTSSQQAGKLWKVFATVLIAIQLGDLILSRKEVVKVQDFRYSPSDVEKTKTTPVFNFEHGTTNVEIKLFAPVSNNWMEIQGDLVNDDNGETEEFAQGAEYYSGYDSDGSWSEGDQTNSLILSSVPPGRYHLNLEATSGNPALEQDYRITVTRGVSTWSNFIWAFILLSVYPLFVWWRGRKVELERWSESDYNPYGSSHGGDDE